MKKPHVKSILFWIISSTALGTAVTFYISPGTAFPFWKLWTGALFITYVISIFSAITGYTLGSWLRHKSSRTAMLVTAPLTILAALAGYGLSVAIIRIALVPSASMLLEDRIIFFIIPIIIINLSITLIIVRFKRLKNRKEELEGHIEAIQAELVMQDGGSGDFIMIREKGNTYRLPVEDIIYISSHGKKAIVHTENREYELSALMKDIMEKLPASIFYRIHKRFAANTAYISHVRYYLGGRYLLYLKNKEEDVLPIGITYTKALKAKLGI
jgi:DNA-binding LytR/AlgR family response regulator